MKYNCHAAGFSASETKPKSKPNPQKIKQKPNKKKGSCFRKAAPGELMNIKFFQFYSLWTALSMIHSGRIWNIVFPLMSCHTGLTAGFPVDFLYSLAQIRKTEYRFPVYSSKLQNFLLVSVCCMYLFFIVFFTFTFPSLPPPIYPRASCFQHPIVPSLSSVVHMQTRQKSRRQRACDKVQNNLTLFSSEETWHKHQLQKQLQR